MDGLAQKFAGRVDFIKLDIDKTETLPLRQQFNMVQRSTYALIDAKGDVIHRWFGFLDEAELEKVINDYLAQQG